MSDPVQQNELRAVIIDVGNTAVRAVAWQAGSELPGSKGRRNPAALPALQRLGDAASGAEAEVESLLEGLPDVPIVVTSVVPDTTSLILARCPRATVIDHTLEMPFRWSLPEPAGVGPDRLCNVAAATAAGYGSALIVDAGTATTFDLLLEGEFRGGFIAPGMALAAEALADRAARLNAVPFAPAAWDVGRDTTAAMAGGAFHAGVGGIRSVVAGLVDRYGPLSVIFTGGLGQLAAQDPQSFDADWTLRGAAILGHSESV